MSPIHQFLTYFAAKLPLRISHDTRRLRRKHVETYLNEFVFRFNRRFYRHVSFEMMLGLASHHQPTGYRDIIGRANPQKGAPTIRRQPRLREAATECAVMAPAASPG